MCDKACQSVTSTQQAEGRPSPLTCFIYLGASSRDSKKFNEFDACLLAISKKSRKTWNYLFPQVMSTWRNISKEGKSWCTYQNKHNLEPSVHFRARTADIWSTEKGYTSLSRKCFPVWGIWRSKLPRCLFVLALPGSLQSIEKQKVVPSTDVLAKDLVSATTDVEICQSLNPMKNKFSDFHGQLWSEEKWKPEIMPAGQCVPFSAAWSCLQMFPLDVHSIWVYSSSMGYSSSKGWCIVGTKPVDCNILMK